jgi:hypothetical protein
MPKRLQALHLQNAAGVRSDQGDSSGMEPLGSQTVKVFWNWALTTRQEIATEAPEPQNDSNTLCSKWASALQWTHGKEGFSECTH